VAKGIPGPATLPPDPEPVSPEVARQQMLERENQQLRLRVRNLETAVRCAGKILSPFVTTRSAER
jgi:hypothetical protein